MTTHDSQKNHLVITIPDKGIPELLDYRRSILGLLARVEIEHCNANIKGDLMRIYELLSHLQTEEEFFAHQQELTDHEKSKNLLHQS